MYKWSYGWEYVCINHGHMLNDTPQSHPHPHAVCLKCVALRWRHNGRDGVSIHQPHHGLLNCLFRHR